MEEISINKLYFSTTIDMVETLKSHELPKTSLDINKILLQKIKKKIGNKCNHEGFVKEDSIKIIQRSIGKLIASHFTGDIHYNVKLDANICVPAVGSRVKCTVVGKNQAGILSILSPLQIMLSPHTPENSEIFEIIDTNDQIIVEIIGYKVMLNYDYIKVLGKFIKKLN